MTVNLSALALFTAARLGDRDDGQRSSWAIAAEVCGAGLLAAGGWLGGTLVYRNQIGVDHRFANAGKWRALTLPPPARVEETVDVGSGDELGIDQMKMLRLGTHRVVLARTQDGYVAFDDRCTHKGGSLADGTLICGTVQCPWHGSQFDVRSGEARQGPAKHPIRTYEIQQGDGRLRLRFVEPNADAAAESDG
jgi:nitrite reductase/ring-hydroxylating ferredoxin subunit